MSLFEHDDPTQVIGDRSGAFALMFADVTDSWFVGRGPEIAQLGQTKEGRFERKINILLLCDQDGHPLRWQVEPGHRHDSGPMHDMVAAVSPYAWARNVPIVFDRAMGKSAHIHKLVHSKLHFLTAVTKDEFGTYAAPLPTEAFRDFELSNPSEVCDKDVDRARDIARSLSMVEVNPTQFVIDQGVRALCQTDNGRAADAPMEGAEITQRAMAWCRRLEQLGEATPGTSRRSLGMSQGLTRKQVTDYTFLRHLNAEIQESLPAGDAAGLPFWSITELAHDNDKKAQRKAYAALLANNTKSPSKPRPTRSAATDKFASRCKVAAYFNPEMFVQCRVNARAFQDEIRQFVDQTNEAQANPRNHRDSESLRALVRARLVRMGLVDAYVIEVDTTSTEGQRVRHAVRLELNEKDWQNDGCTTVLRFSSGIRTWR